MNKSFEQNKTSYINSNKNDLSNNELAERIRLVADLSLFLSENNSNHINKSFKYYNIIFSNQLNQIKKYMLICLILNLILLIISNVFSMTIIFITILANIGIIYYICIKSLKTDRIKLSQDLINYTEKNKISALNKLKELKK